MSASDQHARSTAVEDQFAEDRALARAGAAGNPAALRTVLERVTGRLRGMAWHVSHDHHDCQDLCQEALLKVTSRAVLERYRGDAPLDAYLVRVGVRAILSIVRTRRDRERRATVLLDRVPERVPVAAEPEARRSLDPPLREALLRLPVRVRLIVLLIAVGEYSYLETADLIGVPVGTVKSAYSRARTLLRGALVTPEPELADDVATGHIVLDDAAFAAWLRRAVLASSGTPSEGRLIDWTLRARQGVEEGPP
jgi:RNA polymerase sigma-70 factor (ECF subfamily)